MALAGIDRPARIRGMNASMTITTQEWTADAAGAAKPSAASTVMNVPCRLNVVSGGEAVRMGFAVNETVYRLRCSLRAANGTDIRLLANQIVTISGVVYEIIGSGKPEGRSGLQTAVVKRRSKGGT